MNIGVPPVLRNMMAEELKDDDASNPLAMKKPKKKTKGKSKKDPIVKQEEHNDKAVPASVGGEKRPKKALIDKQKRKEEIAKLYLQLEKAKEEEVKKRKKKSTKKVQEVKEAGDKKVGKKKKKKSNNVPDGTQTEEISNSSTTNKEKVDNNQKAVGDLNSSQIIGNCSTPSDEIPGTSRSPKTKKGTALSGKQDEDTKQNRPRDKQSSSADAPTTLKKENTKKTDIISTQPAKNCTPPHEQTPAIYVLPAIQDDCDETEDLKSHTRSLGSLTKDDLDHSSGSLSQVLDNESHRSTAGSANHSSSSLRPESCRSLVNSTNSIFSSIQTEDETTKINSPSLQPKGRRLAVKSLHSSVSSLQHNAGKEKLSPNNSVSSLPSPANFYEKKKKVTRDSFLPLLKTTTKGDGETKKAAESIDVPRVTPTTSPKTHKLEPNKQIGREVTGLGKEKTSKELSDIRDSKPSKRLTTLNETKTTSHLSSAMVETKPIPNVFSAIGVTNPSKMLTSIGKTAPSSVLTAKGETKSSEDECRCVPSNLSKAPERGMMTEPKSIESKRNMFEKFYQEKAAAALPPPSDPEERRRTYDIPSTPKTLKGGFVALNVATPIASGKPKAPAPMRVCDFKLSLQDKVESYIDSAIQVIEDERNKEQAKALIRQIDTLGGFPVTKRLSLRDSELVGNMVMAIRNDPSITSVNVSPDLFGGISSTLLDQFIGALRINLHLKTLKFSGVQLGNDFLVSLALSMESNFVIEEIDLSRNLFTNAGLAEFCQSFATSNDTCRVLNLENQTTPISNHSEDDVLRAFQQNKTLIDVKLDFQSKAASKKLQEIISRNRMHPPPKFDVDKKLLDVLSYEAERSQERWDEKNDEDAVLEISDADWDHLYNLSVFFDKRKLKQQVQEASEDFVPSTKRMNADNMTKDEKKEFLFGDFKKVMEESVSCFNSDGSFLTPEFITKFFKEDKEEETLTFDFHGQWKLFKRFPVHDPARGLIVTKFVEALVTHPRRNEITGLNFAGVGIGDDFLIALSDRCLRDGSSCLPLLSMINVETNFINVDGIKALAKCIANPDCWRFLQVVRLENQQNLLKSKAELELARAMRTNYSVVVMSVRVRNLMEKQQISRCVVRNVDFIRQARQRHLKATGQQRERNEVEKFFDRIAANDRSIVEVNLVGTKRFLTLTRDEKLKAAKSFATNSHVKTINMNSCGIDDDFVRIFGASIESNSTIQKIMLEGNDISGDGITALFKSLAKNGAVEEIRLHKQSKLLNTSDEHALAEILAPNKCITKLGIDLRTTMAQVQLDKILSMNRNKVLSKKAESKGENFKPDDCVPFMKF